MISPEKQLLAERIQKNRKRIWEWHLVHARNTPLPFYCSIDLRDSGKKIVPVDSNLFPGGFNNICPEDLRTCPPIFRAQIEAISIQLSREVPKKILILPESHTHNLFYIENIYYLMQIVRNAGFECELGWVREAEPVHLRSESGKELAAHPIQSKEGVLSAGEFIPDLVLLNNDFSGGYPAILDSIDQPVIPSHRLGWHSRKKSEHFQYYNGLAAEFAKIIDIDPWLLQIDTEEVHPVNFNEEIGIEAVAQAVERVLDRTKKSYDTHKISHPPFVYVKNNMGTYGMGIMVVRTADEVRHMNRRTKNKMSVGKNHLSINSVVVQEGVPTATLVDRLAAEPVIYLFGSELIGGFLRTNPKKTVEENLNSQGMVFKKLCMSDLRTPEPEEQEPVLELVYGEIARISALAAGMELRRLTQNP